MILVNQYYLGGARQDMEGKKRLKTEPDGELSA